MILHMGTMISVSDISKTFTLTRAQMKKQNLTSRKLQAVNHLSFSVEEGEVLGILGANGAGKTTTLRMLAGLIKPDSGSIRIAGTLTPDDAKKRIGFLTNDMHLDGYFTPDYMFDFFAGLYGVPMEEAQSRKSALFQKFGIDAFRNMRIRELSTGMKQKVSLAVSSAHNPQIIIYDEPTNGLDIIAAKTVEDYLWELHQEGKTIILSTHILSLVEKLCQRILIIDNGQTVSEDTVSDIMAHSSLEQYFYSQYQHAPNR